jgi:hypothetical protein
MGAADAHADSAAGVPFYPRGYPMEQRWPKVAQQLLLPLP